MLNRALKWGDNDRYFGPFTWAYSKTYRHWAIVLKSDVKEDSDCGTSLRFNAGGGTLILTLPQIIKPHVRRVFPGWDQATVTRLGRDYYDLSTERAFGFSYSDGFLQVFRGLRTNDSSTDRSWSCFLPWTQWRHIRYSIYGLEGEHIWSELDWIETLYSSRRPDLVEDRWELRRKWEAACPVAKFKIKDFDDQEIVATTRIEQREWRFGTGWFKWLSWVRRAKIRSSLHIEFSDETGPEKGSWKGGTIGTSIDMLPGEKHETAFRRYCDQEHRSKYRKYSVKFVSRVSPGSAPIVNQ